MLRSLFFKNTGKTFQISIGEEGIVVVYCYKGKALNKLFVRSPDPANSQKLSQLLYSDPDAPIYIYIDVLDQSYLQRTLPAVSPIGINRIARTRLDKEVPKNFLKALVQLGRDKIGRRDWIYTFIAIHLEKPITTWLEFLYPFPNIIKGIYFLPVEVGGILIKSHAFNKEAKPLLKDLKSCLNLFKLNLKSCFNLLKTYFIHNDKSDLDIIITHHKAGGFRQIAFINNKIIFSRLLNNINDPNPDVVAGNIEQEISNSVEYISRLSIGSGKAISVYIILSKEIIKFIREEKIKATKIHLYTPYKFAQLLEVSDAASSEKDRFSDPILLTAFSKYSSRLITLHTALTKSVARALTIVSITHSFCSFLTPILAVIILYQLISIVNWSATAKSFETQIKTLNTQINYKNTTLINDEAVIKEKIPIDQITEIVDVNKIVGKVSQDPITFFVKLSEILPDYIQVISIQWVYDDSELFANGKFVEFSSLNALDANRKYSLTLKVTLKFTNFGTTYEELYEKYQSFKKSVKSQFNHYELQISDLPETFSIEDLNKEIIINISMKHGNEVIVQRAPTQSSESKLLEEYKIPVK